MAYQLKHECQTCGHSIPLALTYCGGEECLNRYAEDNELDGHPYADFKAWQQVATKAQADVDYHEWAVAHRDLDQLQEEEYLDRHDQENIDALRAQLFFETALS